MATRIPPEILHTIFKELENHHLSKYILVSKYWCSNILPILWSNPLEKMYWQYHYRIIEVYISCLNKESKQILREHNIIHEATKESFSATYDYTQYLREVEFNGLYEACGNCESRLSDSIKKSKKDNIYDKQLQSRIIFKEVLKLFVENRLIRYKLIIQSGFYSFNHLSVIPEIIPNGSHLDFMRINSNNQHSVLESLTSYLINGLPTINFLKIHMTNKDMPKLSNSINEVLIKNKDSLIHLWLKQGGNCFNLDIFKQCKNLKTLRITDSHLSDAKNMKPSFWTEDTLIPFISSSPTNSLNRLTEFSLSIDASVNLIHLSTIIQNTCGLLEYLFLKWEIEQDSQNSCLLFQSILENCQKLSGIFITTSIDTIKFIPRFLMECSKLKYLGVDCLRKDNLDLTDWLPKIGMAIRNRNNNDSLTQIELLGFYFKFISSVKSFNEFLDDCSSNNGDKCEKDDLLELYFHNAIDWMNEEKIILLRQYANSDKIQCSLSEIDEIVLYNIENNIL
ncbi:11122_t:CDS:2 [Rhizophagus irregularis]|nr:11122_t:CDS:2 [Rhizophagus irregularis]